MVARTPAVGNQPIWIVALMACKISKYRSLQDRHLVEQHEHVWVFIATKGYMADSATNQG